MKYYNILDAIKTLCKKQPNTGDVFEGDIYNNINNREDVLYTAFNILLQDVTERRDEYYKDFHFYVFYVDRLFTDGSNLVDIQSHGIEVLATIINELEEAGAIIDQVQYIPFKEKFNDVCGGVYADFIVRVQTDDCGDYELNI